ncbi:MAG: exosome complex RNA-binding protein Csl4 [Candidatus ainarchaeum sp.]|nr:exosome complex RNA-binding protein Csl4 [Candidatus ainarchaeum sp.]
MKKIAVTGEKLGNEEDLMIVGDAYIDNAGNIFPRSASTVELDDDTITIESLHKQKILQGDIVVGSVVEIKKNYATLELQKNITMDKTISGKANLSMSEIAFAYVKEIRDALRIGDIVKAKVKSCEKNVVELTLKDRGSGVIIAYCMGCRRKLDKKIIFRNKDISTIQCSNCHAKQTRKFEGGF